MKQRLLLLLTALLVVAAFVPVRAQQKQKFSIVSFEHDPFDGTARNPKYEKLDGSGARYAIIKVTSTPADDNLANYNFNFGNLSSTVQNHESELWVYVQRNAKLVSIAREGYAPINRHDLGLTIEAGETYTMRLSSAGRVAYHQMLMFNLTPAVANAIVMIKKEGGDMLEELFGTTDESGMVAKSLELGTYTYRVIADNYHTSTGRLVLADRTKNHVEDVPLQSNYAEISLTVDADADIYINKEKKGTREWKGILKSGTYEITCRQQNHQPTTRFITVEENKAQTVVLTPPTPITGDLSITSRPLGATISIDGQEYGQTPRIINDLIIGQHTVTLTKDNYDAETQAFEVKEGDMTEINLKLIANGMATTENKPLMSQQMQNINSKGNDVDVTRMINKANKKAKRLRITGWVFEVCSFISGGLFFADALGEDEYPGFYYGMSALCIGAGNIIAVPCFIRAHHFKKQASRYSVQSASLYQHDFMLKNGTSFSTGVNMLQDNMHHTPTLGVGLSYNF